MFSVKGNIAAALCGKNFAFRQYIQKYNVNFIYFTALEIYNEYCYNLTVRCNIGTFYFRKERVWTVYIFIEKNP